MIGYSQAPESKQQIKLTLKSAAPLRKITSKFDDDSDDDGDCGEYCRWAVCDTVCHCSRNDEFRFNRFSKLGERKGSSNHCIISSCQHCQTD